MLSDSSGPMKDVADPETVLEATRTFSSVRLSEECNRRDELERIVSILNNSNEIPPIVVKVLFRIARTAPFEDVRSTLMDLYNEITSSLPDLKVKEIPLSTFFPRQDLTSVEKIMSASPQLVPWFEDLFMLSGRLSNLEQLVSMLPAFFPAFVTTLNQIMRLDGPLPISWRHYIAILASARFNCEYLITIGELEFLQAKGDPMWLRGLEYAPKKIQSLMEFNACLAHQPWRLNEAMVKDLVEGSDSWSISELVHAIVIMATYHMLSGLVFGFGIAPELDLAGRYQSKSWSEEYTDIDIVIQKSNDEGTQSLRELLSSNVDALMEEEPALGPLALEFDPEPENSDSTNLLHSGGDSTISWLLSSLPPIMEYEDFFKAKYRRKTFRLEDYSWKDHGYSLLSRYYGEAARALDEEWDFIFSYTDNYMNTEHGVDTGPFRRAIWHYAHSLYGMTSDAYNYRRVNVFLNKNIKSFIKRVVCHPNSTSRKDFQQMGYNLKPEEKVHVGLLALEGRKRACLLYALHAVMEQRK